MSFGYDPEAVYQEADIEQAEFEAQSAEAAALHRRGICTHGWLLNGGVAPKYNRDRAGIEEDRKRGRFPDRPTDPTIQRQNDVPKGMCLCLDCGKLVPDPLARRVR